MEQNHISKKREPKPALAKKTPKRRDSFGIRFNKEFMKKISKLVDRANKKPFGKKVVPRAIIENLLHLADDKLLDNIIKKSQEESLSHNDKREIFLKEKLSQFSGSKEQLELKMMEVFNQYLSQNQG